MLGKNVPGNHRSHYAGAVLALLSVSSVGRADTLSVPADADTLVRTDVDERRNDNYGCDAYLELGTSRGGGGIPWGGPDAERSFIHFALPAVSAGNVVRAELQMTFWQVNAGTGSSAFEADVHRVVASGDV